MNSRLNMAVVKRIGVVTAGALLVLLASLCFGQQLTGILTGTTFDPSGAVVPNAQLHKR